MHLSPETVALFIMTINAAVCAGVPQSVKDKSPAVWAILDAMAVNVGSAKNASSKQQPWQLGVAVAVISAVLTIVGASVVAPQPAPANWPPVNAEAPVSVADFDAVALADAVSPAEDVSAVSPTDH
jgi:hypothetical protein